VAVTEQERPGTATRDLRPLLSPDSIAIVGASEGSRMTANVLRHLEGHGFKGPIHLVNPRRATVLGRPCYPSLSAIPGSVDCAVVLTPAESVPTVLRESVTVGIQAAIVVASRFAEYPGSEGVRRQEEIADIVASSRLLLCGPNCIGIANVRQGKWVITGTFGSSSDEPRHGGCAIVSQSSGLMLSTLELGLQRGLGFHTLVASGNEVGLTTADYIDHLLDDRACTVIGAIVESFRDAEGFLRIAQRAASQGVPLVILKNGRTSAGVRAVASHTASIAGDFAVQQAVLAGAAVTMVDSIDELVEACLVFSKAPLPAGPGFFGLSISGGGNALLADLAVRHGLSLPRLSKGAERKLRGMLRPSATVANPLDPTDILETPGLLEATLDVVLAEEALHTYAFVVPLRRSGPATATQPLIPQVERAAARHRKPVAVVSMVSEALGGEWRRTAEDSPLPFLQDVDLGIKSLARLNVYAERLRRWEREGKSPVVPDRIPRAARLALKSSDGVSPVVVGRKAKAVLEAYGIKVSDGQLVRSADEAVSAGEAIGLPVVMKASSRDILHMAERGLVLLNVSNAEAVRDAYGLLVERFRLAAPASRLEGILVERMVPSGLEVFVGAKRSEFGPVVLAGLGGAAVEGQPDIAIRKAPLGRRTAAQMVDETPIAGLIRGPLGSKTRAAVERLLVRASVLAWSLRDQFDSLDINPAIVNPDAGAVAVDCVVVLDPSRAGDGPDAIRKTVAGNGALHGPS
jgi:acetate---CoA ligase (ADP-forming)